jgi:septal ring factor EnvC (AmiA/AmiB activator)
MTPDEIKKKIDDLSRRTEVAQKKKSQYEGQLQKVKEDLADLVTEVKAAGYDPKNLSAERDKAEASLLQEIAEYETKLLAVETSLAGYDKK